MQPELLLCLSPFTINSKSTPRMKISPLRSRRNRRSTLRDLYTYGLISIFRRHSVLRIWEPLRETPRRQREEFAS
jgi:hypothetical protein